MRHEVNDGGVQEEPGTARPAEYVARYSPQWLYKYVMSPGRSDPRGEPEVLLVNERMHGQGAGTDCARGPARHVKVSV